MDMLPGGIGQLNNENVVFDEGSIVHVELLPVSEVLGQSRAGISERFEHVGFFRKRHGRIIAGFLCLSIGESLQAGRNYATTRNGDGAVIAVEMA